MKGLFIPDITAEMFRNGCLEGIEALMAEGEIYDIEYSTWIPVKYRPMTDEEYIEFRREWGEVPEEERIMFDCQMPKDGQEILITTSYGVDHDICDYNDGYGLEGRGDWDGVLAWMPLPEPYNSEVKDD